LTLIELVVVIAMIAILAVMVVPRLDFLKAQAEHASSAATQGDLGSMIQVFKASSGKYPNFDTLIDTSGNVFSKLQSHSTAGALDATTIPGVGQNGLPGWYRSLTDAGLQFGYRHDASASDASSSASTTLVDMSEAAYGSLKLATLKTTGGGSAAGAIRTAIYPGGATFVPASNGPDGIAGTSDDVAATTTQSPAGTVPATSMLVVFGIGPRSNLVSNVLATAPSSAMAADDSTQTYCRYLAVFEIFQNGAPAKFRMITDHRLRQIQARVDLYKQGSAIQ
jgi:type II secretory pathway pseudopilin PulG